MSWLDTQMFGKLMSNLHFSLRFSQLLLQPRWRNTW